jgi:hypothetical protein
LSVWLKTISDAYTLTLALVNRFVITICDQISKTFSSHLIRGMGSKGIDSGLSILLNAIHCARMSLQRRQSPHMAAVFGGYTGSQRCLESCWETSLTKSASLSVAIIAFLLFFSSQYPTYSYISSVSGVVCFTQATLLYRLQDLQLDASVQEMPSTDLIQTSFAIVSHSCFYVCIHQASLWFPI